MYYFPFLFSMYVFFYCSGGLLAKILFYFNLLVKMHCEIVTSYLTLSYLSIWPKQVITVLLFKRTLSLKNGPTMPYDAAYVGNLLGFGGWMCFCTDCLYAKHNIGLEGVNQRSYLSVSLAVYPEPMSIDSSKSLSMHGMNSATQTDFIRCHCRLWSPPKQLRGPWTMSYINARSQQSEFLIDSFNLLYRINDLEECIRFLSQMLLIEGWSSKRMQPLHIKAVPRAAQRCN